MIGHMLFFARNNWVINLPDLEFPDGMSNAQLRNYVMNEWKMPSDLLEGYIIPPDMKLRIVLSPISEEKNMVYIFLIAPSPDVKLALTPIPMTPDQTRVLNCIKKGMSIQQMTRALFRSTRWVQYRVAEIKQYLNVKKRHDLAGKIDSKTYLRMR